MFHFFMFYFFIVGFKVRIQFPGRFTSVWITAVLLLLISAQGVHAQRQTVQVVGIPPLINGAHAGADFDGDGDEDVFVTGRSIDGTLHAALYRFQRRRVVQTSPLAKPSVFADYQQVDFLKTSVMKGSVTWHDLNRDGRIDLIVTGQTVSAFTPDLQEILTPTTTIYMNNPITFNIAANTGLPGVYNSKVAAGDFNGDGIEDIVMGGMSQSGLILGVWLGDNARRYTPGPTTFEGLKVTSISVADIDSDGDLDFIVAGSDAKGLAHIKMFENDGTARFTERPTPVPNLYVAGTDFGDIDFDGDPDLLVNGGFLDPGIFRGVTLLYENDGAGNFTLMESNFTGLFGGGVALIDLDGDNDADVFSWGIESFGQIGTEKITVGENIDSFFLPIGSAPSVINGAVSWFDYDGNGRKDAFVSGMVGQDPTLFIYEF